MNEDLMRKLGFGEQVDMVKKGICPICKKKVDKTKFISDIERKENEISGLCKTCQDEIF